MAGDSASEAAEMAAAPSRREIAVARSLESARNRAESRVQRFLDAGLELANESSSGRDFTVHEVVERSGQSLRSFYQYFDGKHELLLALLEESVRSTADHLRRHNEGVSDVAERLHRFVTECHRLCRPSRRPASRRSPAPVLVEFAQQLLTAHPAEASRAFLPLVALLTELLEQAAGAGVVRPDLGRGLMAGMVLEAVMVNACSSTLGAAVVGDHAVGPEELWQFVFHGIAAR